METYLVGGAVRDKLLGKTPRENDYVVVGTTAEELIKLGFKQVGKDFPVFLHPKTQEEYALARTEKKQGVGYHGFIMDANPTVTLEEDLKRRDLTINAIAEDNNHQIIDPYGGQQDLQNQVLRHVSDAFVEDPLRVLRVARFQAMLPNFTIAPETMEMMKAISQSPNELSSISNERIWLEVMKSCQYEHPDLFWSVMEQSGASLALGFHLDTDTLCSDVQNSSSNGIYRLISGLWSQSPQHIQSLLDRSPPSVLGDFAQLICLYGTEIKQGSNQSAKQILTLCQRMDPFRRFERAVELIQTLPSSQEVTRQFWLSVFNQLTKLDIQAVIGQVAPADRAEAIQNHRLNVIKHLLENK